MKTKKIIAAVTALTILGGAMPYSGIVLPARSVTAEAADAAETVKDGITYKVYSDHAEVIKADEELSGKIVIPDKIEGKPVTVIGDEAFRNEDVLLRELEITLPDTIEKIGASAFKACNLVNFRMPAELRVIGDKAFFNCRLGDVSFPDKLESIGERAFYYATLGEELTFPSSLVTIGESAFAENMTFKTVTIPGSVQNMGRDVFRNAIMLRKAVFEEGVKSVPDGTFDLNGCFVPLDLLNDENFTIGLKEVVLPDGLTEIGERAFRDAAFTEIDIPDSVRFIGGDAFYGCYCLERIAIPEGVEEIGYGTFATCHKLAEVSLPSTLKKLGDCSFHTCWELEDISLPDGLEEIGGLALARTALKTVDVPASVKRLSEGAFNGCESLTDITFYNPDCLIPAVKSVVCNYTTITETFEGTIHGYADSTAQDYADLCGYEFALIDAAVTPPQEITEPVTPEDPSLTIQDGITYRICDDHAEVVRIDVKVSGDIVIPDTVEGKPVTVIGETAFVKETGRMLTGVTLPDTVEIIGNGAFADSSIKKMVLPASLKTIGDAAFIRCAMLEEVVFNEGLEKIDQSAFSECSALSKFELPGTLREIGECAFWGASALKEVTIPGSVETMGEYIFEDCVSLEKVVFGEGVKYIPDNMFATESEGLKEVVLPGSLEVIGIRAFENGRFAEIDIPENVREIGYNAFYGCAALTEVKIPESCEKIGPSAFQNCTSLKKATLPADLKVIGYNVFDGCTALETVNIPAGLEEIKDEAFRCTAIKSIELPETLKSVGRDAFTGCSKLRKIVFNSPGCEIDHCISTINNKKEYPYSFTGTIYGYDGSTAEAYAADFDVQFVSLGADEAAAVPANAGKNDGVYGDANADRVINVADSVTVLQYTANKTKYALTEEQIKNADVDGIKGITGSDAIVIQKVDAGLLNAADLPLGK